MGEVYSHLSEEERQVIQIEIGNGTGVRAMARIIPDKTAGASLDAQPSLFSALPPDARPGVTYDNGTEFARHAELRDGLGMATYFADPSTPASAAATRTGTA